MMMTAVTTLIATAPGVSVGGLLIHVDPTISALWVLLLIAGATFISEDLTCIAPGLLIHQGQVDLAVGLAGCFCGIVVSDMGLWGLGRTLRWRGVRWRWFSALASSGHAMRISGWFDRNAGGAIMASRFLPGSRLPLYVTLGAMGARPTKLAGWTVLAALIWTPLIVLPIAWMGERITEPLTDWLGGGWFALLLTAILLMVLFRLVVGLCTPIGRSRIMAKVSRLWRWEFWPTWLFYLPLVPWLVYLSIRHRGFGTITAANPGMPMGGVIGESKHDILAKLPPPSAPAFTLIESGEIEARLEALGAFLRQRGIVMPIILKPDVGQRGVGVKLIRDDDAARSYFEATPGPVIAQAYHPGPFEAGIFYYRMPGQERGRLFSITDKQFPVLIGDGVSSVEELIWSHPRYRMQAQTFLTRHAEQVDRILAEGETFKLGVVGNHCQGTEFLDGSHLITPALTEAIDGIARTIDGFYFGRFDIRYNDPAELKAGRGFSIIELNGATSESTNIYDSRRSIWWAYCTLFRQWSLLFRIGSHNRRHGVPSADLRTIMVETWRHYRSRRVCLVAD